MSNRLSRKAYLDQADENKRLLFKLVYTAESTLFKETYFEGFEAKGEC